MRTNYTRKGKGLGTVKEQNMLQLAGSERVGVVGGVRRRARSLVMVASGVAVVLAVVAGVVAVQGWQTVQARGRAAGFVAVSAVGAVHEVRGNVAAVYEQAAAPVAQLRVQALRQVADQLAGYQSVSVPVLTAETRAELTAAGAGLGEALDQITGDAGLAAGDRAVAVGQTDAGVLVDRLREAYEDAGSAAGTGGVVPVVVADVEGLVSTVPGDVTIPESVVLLGFTPAPVTGFTRPVPVSDARLVDARAAAAAARVTAGRVVTDGRDRVAEFDEAGEGVREVLHLVQGESVTQSVVVLAGTHHASAELRTGYDAVVAALQGVDAGRVGVAEFAGLVDAYVQAGQALMAAEQAWQTQQTIDATPAGGDGSGGGWSDSGTGWSDSGTGWSGGTGGGGTGGTWLYYLPDGTQVSYAEWQAWNEAVSQPWGGNPTEHEWYDEPR